MYGDPTAAVNPCRYRTHVSPVLLAELAGQLKQRLRDSAGNVGEDQVGHRVVGATKPVSEHPQQLLCDLRTPGDPLEEKGPVPDRDAAARPGRCAAGSGSTSRR